MGNFTFGRVWEEEMTAIEVSNILSAKTRMKSKRQMWATHQFRITERPPHKAPLIMVRGGTSQSLTKSSSWASTR